MLGSVHAGMHEDANEKGQLTHFLETEEQGTLLSEKDCRAWVL